MKLLTRRYQRWGLSALLCGAVAHDLWVIPHRPPGDRLADLDVYLGSVRGLLDGGSLYDFHAANGAPFTYPPFAGLLFVPLVFIPFVHVVWTIATFVAGYFLVRPAHSGLLLGLAVSAPFISNLRFGQVSIFVVLLALVDCLDLPPPRWRGVALGLAAAIKLTPLVFVPYLWLTGRRRAAVTSLVVFASSVLVSAAVLPRDTWRWLTREAWNTDRIGNLAQYGNQSVNGALLRLGDVPRWLLALICLVVLVVAYARARRLDPMTGFVVVGAAGLAVSPVSWTHHQFVLYLAVVLLVLARQWFVAALVAAIMIIPLDAFVAVGLRDLRVWLAVLLVLTLGYPVPPFERAWDWIAHRRSQAGERPQPPAGSGVV